MSQINVGGVVKGGLAAGVVITISEFVLNVPVAGEQMNAEFAARNLPPVSTNQIAVFVVLSFLLGLATVWLYAAIRPRLGAGPKTAITAGLFVWACHLVGVECRPSNARNIAVSRRASVEILDALVGPKA